MSTNIYKISKKQKTILFGVDRKVRSECPLSYSPTLGRTNVFILPYVAWIATRFDKYVWGKTVKSSYRFPDILLHFYIFVPLHFSRICVESGTISLKSTFV